MNHAERETRLSGSDSLQGEGGADRVTASRQFYYIHFVYRIFDAQGSLLYVGTTDDMRQRIRAHVRVQPWWDEVADIKVETHLHASAALEAEAVAIATEGPRENRTMPRVGVAEVLTHERSQMAREDDWEEKLLLRGHIASPGTETGRVFGAVSSFKQGATARAIARRSGAPEDHVEYVLFRLRDAGMVHLTKKYWWAATRDDAVRSDMVVACSVAPDQRTARTPAAGTRALGTRWDALLLFDKEVLAWIQSNEQGALGPSAIARHFSVDRSRVTRSLGRLRRAGKVAPDGLGGWTT